MPLLALNALLEVMDKEASIASFWWIALLLGGVGYFAGRWRWWAGLPVLVLLSASAVGPWLEWRDPFVGPAIAREAGTSYPYHLAVSKLLGAALTVAGMSRRRAAA